MRSSRVVLDPRPCSTYSLIQSRIRVEGLRAGHLQQSHMLLTTVLRKLPLVVPWHVHMQFDDPFRILRFQDLGEICVNATAR